MHRADFFDWETRRQLLVPDVGGRDGCFQHLCAYWKGWKYHGSWCVSPYLLLNLIRGNEGEYLLTFAGTRRAGQYFSDGQLIGTVDGDPAARECVGGGRVVDVAMRIECGECYG